MIDRRALWISIFVLIALIAADVWRLSLLPDWHHVPAEGPGSIHNLPVLLFFTPVLGLLFTLGVFFSRNWLRSGTEEAVQPWRRLNGGMLLFNATMMALANTFGIARSMGALHAIDRITLSHVIMVVTGIFMMVVGNIAPKMPHLTARFRSARLDPWQWNQHLRFTGKVTFAFGLFTAVVMPLVPVKMFLPTMLGLMLAIFAANYWHRAKVKREPSPQP